MSPGSFLLRCLLCLCLVVNGLGSAVAGVRMMQPMAKAAPEETPSVASAMAMPCHEEGSGPSGERMVDAPALAEHDQAPADSGCCHSSACCCDCMHSAQAELSVPMMMALRLPQRETPQASREDYAPPALSLPIRPPIGLRS
ncbi:CopL family metal-binding regulatory protein [Arenimonas sp.]|uniref:CopL family metal-binding regulatory protein n=1 Tax=Arenimonas sp. TaxID=1872635 RepID=UPI0039E2D597